MTLIKMAIIVVMIIKTITAYDKFWGASRIMVENNKLQ